MCTAHTKTKSHKKTFYRLLLIAKKKEKKNTSKESVCSTQLPCVYFAVCLFYS